MNRPARFITFEGIEGVGKSTQVAALAAALAARGIAHLVTREPGGTPLAEKIRALVLEAGPEVLPAAAELLLMFAARAVHLANRIEPALREGRWVLCDRFTDATFAYQGAGRGVGDAVIASLENFVQGERRPDLTLVLDLPVPKALERAHLRDPGAKPDRFEAQRADFFERVRKAYLARAAAHAARCVVINADRPATEVARAVLAAIESKQWIS
jgi:dTMP kinase